MNKKRYYIFTPPHHFRGPELAHQMCHELLLQNRQAWMYYIKSPNKEPIDIPSNERYRKYGTSHTLNMAEVEQTGSVIIVPEACATWVFAYQKCKKVLWWMSVDNFIINEELVGFDIFDSLKQEVSLHLVQSQYAYQYLLQRGISSKDILYVSDYIGENYGRFQLPETYRKNIALYNPRKGNSQAMQPLIDQTNWLKWIPLRNYTEEEMIALMEISKLYIDFGTHPGKDRIPREAASCGCCIVTNRKGSANFYEDIPIPDCYKINNNPIDYTQTAQLLLDICMHWGEHNRQFDYYRQSIASEREKFSKDVKKFVNTIETEHGTK